MSAGFSRRRAVVSAATVVAMPAFFIRPARAADLKFRQFHNQSATSPLHKHLVDMWAAVKAETGGRVETEVFPQNNKIHGSDPAALEMLIAGEIEFFTLMGSILRQAVPVAEVQQVPFSFTSEAQAHAAVDGPGRKSSARNAGACSKTMSASSGKLAAA